jgi:hypothetical protein
MDWNAFVSPPLLISQIMPVLPIIIGQFITDDRSTSFFPAITESDEAYDALRIKLRHALLPVQVMEHV